VVPGHGALVDGADFGSVLNAHRFVLETARASQEQGLGPLEAVRAADLAEFARWPTANVWCSTCIGPTPNLPVWRGLLAAFTDAVTYHAGPPRCAV